MSPDTHTSLATIVVRLKSPKFNYRLLQLRSPYDFANDKIFWMNVSVAAASRHTESF